MNKKINFLKSKENSGYIFQDCNVNVIHSDNFKMDWNAVALNNSAIWKNFNSVIDRNSVCKKIDKMLDENDNLIISSIGGLGKTELVKQYLFIYNNKYSNIIWFTYKNNLKTTLLASFGDKIGQFINEDFCYLMILNNIRKLNEDSIIVFDNMDSSDSDDIQEIFSWSSKIILTTRLKFSHFEDRNNIKIYFLETMLDDQIKKLFEYYSRKELDQDSLDFILEKTKGHTLAIKMLAKTLYCSNLSLDQFIDEIVRTGFDLSNIYETVTDDNGKEDKRFIDHIVKLYDISDKNVNLSKTEKNLLKNISILPYENINLAKIKKYLKLNDYNGIYRLYEIGWVEIYFTDDKFLSLHPILSEIIRKKLNITFGDCKNMISFLGEFDIESLEKINQYRKEYLIDAIAVSEFWLKEKKYDRRILINVIRNIAFSYYNLLYSEYTKAIYWFKIYVDLSKNILEKVMSNYDLGNAYEDYGDYDQSIYFLKKALFLSYISFQNTDRAKIYMSLGVSYSRLENKYFNKALKCYNRAIKIYKAKLGDKCYEIAVLENNKGALFRKYNKLEEAIIYHENAIKRMKNCVDENLDLYPRLALMYNSFGNTLLDIYNNSNNFDNLKYALECFTRAKDIQDKYTEDGNPDIAKTYLSLANCFEIMGKYDIAQNYYIKAYEINHKLLQNIHPLFQANIEGLKRIYSKNGLSISEFDVWLKTQLN